MHYHVWGAVGVWVCELLAQRRGTSDKAQGTTLACVRGFVHLWVGSGHGGDGSY